ncbi:hypothetical protein RchiOBHm_Chr5g0062781 [Rosa chinensis]|uniref:Uncharacterized protein n=1 Tax=Rosa chinensis TaxID=74649 RepID=A0A2P6QI91_ROSCH|nr:uncharacterized protein LOC112166628 [Rosa chinensis]PRQ33897.1 hypothetical protein RchiOBHm_Chr5g0062781 [Rosa chinensis]
MEDMGSIWTTYQESTDDLNKKLLYTTLELETMKNLATESQENVKNLLNLLKVAYKERDEARDQLHKFFNKITASTPIDLPNVQFNQVVQPESPTLMPTKANSSITESNSLSETYNPQSHISSPVDSLFDAVSSPEFSNINMADSSNNMGFVKQPLVKEFNGSTIIPTGVVVSSGSSIKADPANEIIDNFVRGRPLPQKGMLLQAVMDAGPLLQTLLVAGPMPRWRNPPPLQPFKIPPVSIKGCEAAVSFNNQKPVASPTYVVHKTQNATSYPEMTRGFSQTCSAAMLNFNNVNPNAVSYLNNSRMPSSISSFDHQIPIAKRHRLQ